MAELPSLRSSADVRRQALLASLRQRYRQALARGDAPARQALFQEAVYLDLPPRLWQEEEGPGADGAVLPDSTPRLR